MTSHLILKIAEIAIKQIFQRTIMATKLTLQNVIMAIKIILEYVTMANEEILQNSRSDLMANCT